MTDMYTTQEGNKKKYLVPAIILMLCAVSLTGAAYAYNTTVTDEKIVTADYDDTLDFTLTCNGKIYFDVVKDKTKDPNTTVYNINSKDTVVIGVKATVKQGVTITKDNFKVAVYSDAACTKEVTYLKATLDGSGVDYTITFSGSNITEQPAKTYYVQVVLGNTVQVTPMSS